MSTGLAAASRAAALRNQKIASNGGEKIPPVTLQRSQRLANAPVATAETAPATKRSAGGMQLASRIKAKRPTAIAGVRVLIRDENDDVIVDSITASDGSFYFGDLKPGKYTLDVDAKTIPAGYVMLQMSKEINIESVDDYQEITLPPIYVAAVEQ